jgi:DUF971 family protein
VEDLRDQRRAAQRPAVTPHPRFEGAPVEAHIRRDERRLVLVWDDGHVSPMEFDELRSMCPCALCQGHSGEHRHLGLRDQDLSSVRAVGNYALSLVWADGHDTGIYPYAMLRSLCPCDDCRGQRP